MDNPYRPPGSTELTTDSDGSVRPSRHWFWKAYAVVFAAALLIDTVIFVSAHMPLLGIVVHVVRVLAGVGVAAYAFSKWIGPRWVWRLLWWVLPLGELAVYVIDRVAFERFLSDHPGVRAMSTVQLPALFAPLASLALYRLSRIRLLTA
jgi:hypothetical protein